MTGGTFNANGGTAGGANGGGGGGGGNYLMADAYAGVQTQTVLGGPVPGGQGVAGSVGTAVKETFTPTETDALIAEGIFDV